MEKKSKKIRRKSSVISHLKSEYRLLDKPSSRELLRLSSSVMAAAIVSSIVLRAVDAGFGYAVRALIALF